MKSRAIGMMCNFVSRRNVIAWINGLGIPLKKIEDLASGVVYCQICNLVHPGSVAIGRVCLHAKNEWEYISNYKLLQQAFNKQNIKKPIEISKLVKGKVLDNLEFIQWFKQYCEDACKENHLEIPREPQTGASSYEDSLLTELQRISSDRDFLYEKLETIEIYINCLDRRTTEIENIQLILYSSEEDQIHILPDSSLKITVPN